MSILQTILDKQDALNAKHGASSDDIKNLPREEKLRWIRRYARSVTMESSELLEKSGARWWRSEEFPDEELIDETIDVLHFTLSILLCLGVTEEDDLLREYTRKNDKNKTRKDWDKN